MTPSAGVVSLDVARLAVEVESVRGEQTLLSATVNQSIQTLTALVHEVQAEQLRAREDRLEQKEKLSTLVERSNTASAAATKVQELEHRLTYWRGVVVGFAALATLVLGGSVAWITSQFDTASKERAKLELRLEQVERRP